MQIVIKVLINHQINFNFLLKENNYLFLKLTKKI